MQKAGTKITYCSWFEMIHNRCLLIFLNFENEITIVTHTLKNMCVAFLSVAQLQTYLNNT